MRDKIEKAYGDLLLEYCGVSMPPSMVQEITENRSVFETAHPEIFADILKKAEAAKGELSHEDLKAAIGERIAPSLERWRQGDHRSITETPALGREVVERATNGAMTLV